MKTPIGAAVAALALCSTASAQTPTQIYPVHSGPVTITSCSLGQAGSNVAKNSIEVKYFQNVPTRHLVSVTFRINYNGVKIDVTDTGTFTFQAPIDHHFDSPVLDSLTYAGPNPDICRVLVATFGDGQVVRPAYTGPRIGNKIGTGSGTLPSSDGTNTSPAQPEPSQTAPATPAPTGT